MSTWMSNGSQNIEAPIHIEGKFEEEIHSEDWSEWEYVMSPSEEFMQKHNQWQIQRTETELNTLRGTSSQVCIALSPTHHTVHHTFLHHVSFQYCEREYSMNSNTIFSLD